MAENAVKNCLPCQANTPNHHSEPLHMSQCPISEWGNLSADFYGFANRRIPACCSWRIQQIYSSRNHAFHIKQGSYTNFGQDLRTAWKPSFVEDRQRSTVEWRRIKEILWISWVQTSRVTPLWPKANAECERLMKTIGKVIRTAKIENKNWRQELYTFLRALLYRSTPQWTTQKSPAETLLHRTFKTQLSFWNARPQSNKVQASKLWRLSWTRQKRKAPNETVCRCTTSREFTGTPARRPRPNETPKINKFSSYYDPRPYEVTQIKGSMVTASRPGHSVTRNSSFFNRTTAAMPERREEEEDDYDDMTTPQQIQHQQQNQRQQPQQQRRYPQRLRRLPNRLSDFIVY